MPEAGIGGAHGGVEDSRAAVKDKKAANFEAGDLEGGFDSLLRDAADGLGGIGARGRGHGFMDKATGLDVGRHAVCGHLEGYSRDMGGIEVDKGGIEGDRGRWGWRGGRRGSGYLCSGEGTRALGQFP